MSPVSRSSSIAALQRAATLPTPLPSEPLAPSPPKPAAGRPEKPVRITLDLPTADHRWLRDFAADTGTGISVAKILRALLAELRGDRDLADRVRARVWQDK